MSSPVRNLNYRKLRRAGYTAKASTLFKDFAPDRINFLVELAKETDATFKERFEKHFGKIYGIKTVFKT